MVFLRRHGLGNLVALCQHVTAFAPALGELELGPLLTGTLAFEDVDVKVSKLGIVEVEVRSAVGIVVRQIGTCPVEHGHEVVADAVDAFCREVAERLLVDLDLVVAVCSAILDGLYDGQRLNDAPSHAITLNVLAQVADLLTGPDLA